MLGRAARRQSGGRSQFRWLSCVRRWKLRVIWIQWCPVRTSLACKRWRAISKKKGADWKQLRGIRCLVAPSGARPMELVSVRRVMICVARVSVCVYSCTGEGCVVGWGGVGCWRVLKVNAGMTQRTQIAPKLNKLNWEKRRRQTRLDHTHKNAVRFEKDLGCFFFPWARASWITMCQALLCCWAWIAHNV